MHKKKSIDSALQEVDGIKQPLTTNDSSIENIKHWGGGGRSESKINLCYFQRRYRSDGDIYLPGLPRGPGQRRGIRQRVPVRTESTPPTCQYGPKSGL